MAATQHPDYISDAVKALIGFEAEPMEATHPIEESEVRRFHHAIMDLDAPDGSPSAQRAARLGKVVPATFSTFAFRRGYGDLDPLAAMKDQPHHDGLDKPFRNLPLIPVPLRRILNGGYEYYFFRFAQLGERLFRYSRYRDIYQRNGKQGPMIFAVIDDLYCGEGKSLLLGSTQTIIIR